MTAIALLNPEHDPHVVADTLLTAKGRDPNSQTTIWLPALGVVQSEWEIGGIPWYIAQLGRKTFFLPNRSGILTFAGDCMTAFHFWAELSSKFLNVTAFEPTRKVDRQMVCDALGHAKAEAISLLGVLIDDQGRLESFVQNPTRTLATRILGTCYVAGSGTALVSDIIEAHDQQLDQQPKDAVLRRMSPTEDLAERIASQMLYAESDQNNGRPGTPIGLRCGGYYEWYQVRPQGILPLRTRLDLNIEEIDGNLWISRAYLSEQAQLKVPPPGLVPSQNYSVRVLNLGLTPMELVPTSGDWWEFTPAECYGVHIESTFKLYDGLGGTARVEGLATNDLLAELFGMPIEVIRIRLVCSRQGQAIMRSASKLAEEKVALARIFFKDDRIRVQLRREVADMALNCLQRIGS